MAELAQAQETLKETLDKVATLEAQFDEANTKKVRRENGRIFIINQRDELVLSSIENKICVATMQFFSWTHLFL